MLLCYLKRLKVKIFFVFQLVLQHKRAAQMGGMLKMN